MPDPSEIARGAPASSPVTAADSCETAPPQTRPGVDRAWELMERAYSDQEMKVVGWASSHLMSWDTAAGGGEDSQGITFSAFRQVQRSHEDEVLVIAIRVPHPDEMSLAEVIGPCEVCGDTGREWADYWSEDVEPCRRGCPMVEQTGGDAR